ncbi:MAG: hypothetical protein PUK09_05425, partial [Bacilli bacterium]|nr:hypothetical protein [Bacilli bacterium]
MNGMNVDVNDLVHEIQKLKKVNKSLTDMVFESSFKNINLKEKYEKLLHKYDDALIELNDVKANGLFKDL